MPSRKIPELNKDNSVAIRLPKLSYFQNGNYTPILVLLLIVSAFLLGVLITKVSYLENGKGTKVAQNAGTDTTAGAPATPVPGQPVDVEVGHLPPLGDEDAKVTVIEFSDFQCPFCKQLFETSLSDIKKEYIDTGKVKFYYRHYPIVSIHPNAMKASIATECANDQEKFWEMHDKLFTAQNDWSSVDNAKAVAKFKEYAAEMGIDSGKFDSCLDNDEHKAEIDKDIADGTTAGVNGTPATFVNGVLVSGAVPFEQFKAQIEAALKE